MTATLPCVASNKEKSLAYKEQLARYKNAVSQDFHFEGIFILYAMLEDRLSAFLFYAGVTNCTREKLTTNLKVRPHLDLILARNGKTPRGLRNISIKIDLIRSFLDWSEGSIVDCGNDYASTLARQIQQTAGLESISQTLNEIQDWCKARNVLVHALLTRNPENLHSTLAALTSAGYSHCRKLDNFVKAFKRHNTIRKQFNIQ